LKRRLKHIASWRSLASSLFLALEKSTSSASFETQLSQSLPRQVIPHDLPLLS
jgi:hypothetical protein